MDSIELAISVAGYVLMGISVIGYAFTPPPDYVGREEKILMSIGLYYTIFALMILINALWHRLRIYHFYLMMFELTFMILLLGVVFYGIITLRRVWKFELTRVRDALIYGSIVYLMDKNVYTPITCIVDMDLIILVLSLWIAIMSAYVILKFKRLRFFLAFERFELVSIVFLTTFFIGLCAINGELTESLPYLLIIVLTAYALYVIITEFVRPIVEVR